MTVASGDGVPGHEERRLSYGWALLRAAAYTNGVERVWCCKCGVGGQCGGG